MQSITTGADSTQQEIVDAETVDQQDTPKVDPAEFVSATAEDKQRMATGLRALADWLENTDAPICRWADVQLIVTEYSFDSRGREAWPNVDLVKLRRQIGGLVEKQYSGDTLTLVKSFAPGGSGGAVEARWMVDRRAACEAIPKVDENGEPVMVTRKLPGYTDPEKARELQAQLAELQKTETVQDVEWDCKPLNDSDADGDATEVVEPELPSPAKELTA